MGKTRVCGGTCHNAKGAKCRCWCGGVFHGSAGKENRDAFARQFGVEVLPTTERLFQEQTAQGDLFAKADAGEQWRGVIADAVKSRDGAKREAAHV